MATPLIINAAVSGSAPTSASPHLPRSPEDIGRMAIEVWRAGASIVHIHARNDAGQPSGDIEHFRRAMEVIRSEGCDIIVNLTTSFTASADDIHDVRYAPLELRPELASYDAGTMNFNERVFKNGPQFLQELARRMKAAGVKPEIEVFDVGMIGNAQRIAEEGLIDDPLYFQFVLGVRGGAPATGKQLVHMVESLPPGAVWSVCGVGRSQLDMDAYAILLGGHARTGLEDNLYLERGVPATNGQLVERVAKLSRMLGREVATPAQARQVLGIAQEARRPSAIGEQQGGRT